MVVDADAVFSTLKAKHAAVVSRRAEITAEVGKLGFTVHAGSGAEQTRAKATLAKLNIELASLETDKIALDGALIEAGKRQAEALKTAQAVAEAERQIEIKRLESECRRFGKDADAALQNLISILMNRRDRQAQMRRLGVGRSHELSGANDRRCVETALMQLGRPFPTVEPSQRISFADADGRTLHQKIQIVA